MRHFIGGFLYKVALGAAMLALIALISADLWMWQHDDRPSPAPGADAGAPGPDAGAAGDLALPGLPVRTITGYQENDGAGPNPLTAGASLTDSAKPENIEASLPARDGSGDTANVGDSAALVVQDAEGNIKHQETVR